MYPPQLANLPFGKGCESCEWIIIPQVPFFFISKRDPAENVARRGSPFLNEECPKDG